VPDPEDQQTPPVPPKQLLALLALAAIVGLVVSLAAWCFLEAVHWIQHGVFTGLPKDLGYDDGAPLWWSLPFCGLGGLLTALAITRLPGHGGHVPAHGLSTSPTLPIELPGVILAALATLGLGLVLGPEAPLIALGGGLATFLLQLARRDAPPQVVTVIAASGTFAALSFIFDSPLIASVLLVEAIGIGGPRLTLVLLPGLLAAGTGSLVSIGMGSWTGVSTADYALGPVSLPTFARPDFVDFVWTVPLAIGVAVGAFLILRGARALLRVVESREVVVLPLAGLVVSGLAIAFSAVTDKSVNYVLFSGETALPDLVSGAGTWSVGALLLLILAKGLAWSISLASFRGGPVFPSLFLGAAGGIAASHLAGFAITPAVAVGMGAAVVSILGLPLSAVVLAEVLTLNSGGGASPLIIVGVVVAYLATRALSNAADERAKARSAEPGSPAAAAEAPAAV
jgi:H+/Cl- antiporter ClcA